MKAPNIAGVYARNINLVESLSLGRSSKKYKDFTYSSFLKNTGSELVRHFDNNGRIDYAIFFPGGGLPKFNRIFGSDGRLLKEEKIPGKKHPDFDAFESITYSRGLTGNIVITAKPKNKPANSY